MEGVRVKSRIRDFLRKLMKGKEVVYRIWSGSSFNRPLITIHEEQINHEKVTVR
jgi:hypothetical protein